MRFRFLALLLVVMALGAAMPAQAQPWPPDPGRFFFVWDTYTYHTDERSLDDGTVVPFANDGEFRSYGLKLYAEYALTDRWVLEGETAYLIQRFEDRRGTLKSDGFTDLLLGARRLMQTKPILWTIGGGVSLPFLYDVPDRFTSDPLLGIGSVGVFANTAVGSELLFLPRPVWWKAEIGLTFYADEDILNTAQYELTTGVWVFDFLAISAQLYGTHSLESGPLGRTPPSPSFLTPNVQPGRTSGTASWQVIGKFTEMVAVRVGYYQEIYGQNAGAGDGWTFNVWLRR